MILNANGDTILSYDWGLGQTSNNRAEALALYQGLIQLGKLGINAAFIFGDSTVIISSMVQRKEPTNVFLQQILSCCHGLIQHMEDLSFYHILRGLNRNANK